MHCIHMSKVTRTLDWRVTTKVSGQTYSAVSYIWKLIKVINAAFQQFAIFQQIYMSTVFVQLQNVLIPYWTTLLMSTKYRFYASNLQSTSNGEDSITGNGNPAIIGFPAGFLISFWGLLHGHTSWGENHIIGGLSSYISSAHSNVFSAASALLSSMHVVVCLSFRLPKSQHMCRSRLQHLVAWSLRAFLICVFWQHRYVK